VLPVLQSGAVLLVGQEQVPQTRSLRLALELLDDRWLEVLIAGRFDLLRGGLLGAVDVFVHEGQQTTAEIFNLGRECEIHFSSSRSTIVLEPKFNAPRMNANACTSIRRTPEPWCAPPSS